MNKPSISDVLDRFKAYHEENAAWGSLHIVLDDGNIADDHVQYCIRYAEEVCDTEGAALARILLTMSRTQRSKLGNIA